MHPDRYSRIFLLSHMRAFTSLLGHIFGSHPAISGYFELHISYDDSSALEQQVRELRGHEALKDGSRYLFDKLLHNAYRLSPERLGLDETRLLVSVREPEHSIKSIVHLFAQKGAGERYARPEEATRYYVERLGRLAELCFSQPRQYFYFDAESLRGSPGRLLHALERWLDLDSPLSERYDTFSYTGKPRKGDSSTRIRSGKIDRSASDYSHIRLSPDHLEGAVSAYRECRRTMIDNAADCILM